MSTTTYRRPRRPAADLPGRIVTLGLCLCGKAAHPSRKSAKTFARQHHHAGDVRPYDCPRNPGTWHLGHLPPAIVDGRQPRAYAGQADR